MKRFLAEVIGTFSLIFTGTAAIVVNDTAGAVTHVGISLVFGLIVMAMVYALGDTSGAHINPAVTIAFWVGKRFPGERVIPYLVAQCLGGLLASGLLRILFWEHDTLGATLPAGPWWQSFILEIVLTFMLMFVIFCVSTGSKETGIMAGAAVGAVVALEALFAGPICGASMNPARSLTPALVSGHLEYLWIYLTAPVIGAVLSVYAFAAIYSDNLHPAPAAVPEPAPGSV